MSKVKYLALIIMGIIILFSSSYELQAIDDEKAVNASMDEVSAFNNIVIFIQFADEVSYSPPFNYAYYESMFNGVDQVSLRDYYLEVSYNKLTIDSYLVNDESDFLFYTSPNPRSYYQPRSDTNPDGFIGSNQAEREHELLKQAVDWIELSNVIDDSIDLDVNNDGDIDSLVFLVSGEDDGWSSIFWPHKWSLNSYYDYNQQEYEDDAPMINGYNAWSYTFELLGNSRTYQHKVNVGILAHETFHVLDATDLYHYYRYSWIQPVGDWGLMDQTEIIPSHMLGYMKYQYGGWIDSVPEITESGKYTLYPLQDAEDNIYRIDLGYGNEYIYIEYRNKAGRYESSLPDDGLIIYHVDEDFVNEGNVQGYYDTDLNTREEVWLYRPGMSDVTEPIEFDSEQPSYDVDGNPNNAALSQYNIYDEAGRNTAIQFFNSDGNLINMKITDVEVKDGYVEFIALIDDTALDLNHEYLEVKDAINYIDLPGTEYSFHIDNIPDGFTAHFTIDGTVPSVYDEPYAGQDIEFSATNNTFRLGIFYEGELVDVIEKEFLFTSNFETNHEGYHNFRVEYWYLNFEKITTFDVAFNELFEIEVYFDLVSLIERDGTINSFKGTELSGQSFEYTSRGLVLEFETDYSIDDFYGFKADIEILHTFDTFGYYLNGEKEQYIYVYGDYVEEYLIFVGEGAENAYYAIESELDTNQLGMQYIYYTIFNQDHEILDVLRRTIIVYDDQVPFVSLIGEDHLFIEYGDVYTEEGATFTDDGPVSNEINITSNLDLDVLGTYTISYELTDDAGNVSDIVTRTVVVRDTIAPIVTLNLGIDTIDVGESWVDAGVNASDNYDTEVDVVLMNMSDEFPNDIGSIKVTYEVSDSSGNTVYIDRYINVVEREYVRVELECLEYLSTILKGEEFQLPNCEASNTVVNGIDTSRVDTNFIGTQTIYVSLTIDDIEYTFRTYIFVADRLFYENSLYYYDKKRREQL